MEYLHLIFHRHDLLYAEGALAESLFLGTQTLASLSIDARNEVEALFPQLRRSATTRPNPARPLLQGWQGRLLCHAGTWIVDFRC